MAENGPRVGSAPCEVDSGSSLGSYISKCQELWKCRKMSRIIRQLQNVMQRIFFGNRQEEQDTYSVQMQDQQDSDSVRIQDKQDSDSVQIQDQPYADAVQIEDDQDSLHSDDSFYISRVFYDFSVLHELDQQSDSDSVHQQDQQDDSDSVHQHDQQDSDSVHQQDQQVSDSVRQQDQQVSDFVHQQDQQDSDSVHKQDQQDDSDSVHGQDQQVSDSVHKQDQQDDSDSVHDQDQQVSDSVHKQDQQDDSDSVHDQYQQVSDSVHKQDQQDDSDSVPIHDQQDSGSVQIQDQQESQQDLALDDIMNSLSSSLDDVINSLTSWIASVRSRDPQDSDSDSDSGDKNENPSNFYDVISHFSSHLDSLRADPRRLESIRQSSRFRLCLHSIAYMISVYEYEIDHFNGFLQHYDELIALGFFSSKNKDSVSIREKGKKDFEKGNAALTDMMKLACELGLEHDVDSATRACQLNIKMRRFVGLSDVANSGRWDHVFRYMVESVKLLEERNKACPTWWELQESRQEIIRSHTLYNYEDDECEVEELILFHLLSVWYTILPQHAADVCKSVKFHSRYLDQELSRISNFVAGQPAHRYIQTVGNLMAANDMEFCQLSIDMFDQFEPDVPTHVFGLRLYRLCLSVEEGGLADKAMEMRFTDNPDKQQVTDLLNRLLVILPNNLTQSADRILLNGEHDDVAGEYELPEWLPVADEVHQDTPWWVEEFRQRHQTIDHSPSQEAKPSSTSVCSDATTREPSTSARSRFDKAVLDLPVKDTLDAQAANQETARLFSDIRDGKITFLDVPSVVENPVSLQWEDYRGFRERNTNIGTGIPYHCHVLTYDPIQDEWTARSDMCRISGPLTVEKPGATCVPFLGDSGVHVIEDDFVFKMRISTEDSLRDYMADVITQSMSLWYVDRFSKLTQDRFGYLTMMNSDCVLVYQDSRRNTILELMTREHHFPAARSVIKFDKYTNNTSYRNQKVNTEILEAFSHFTYNESQETLMVTDLQGWVGRDHAHSNIRYVLTDPVIHCPGEPYMFGDTNRRYEGIDQFFRYVHPTCNKICISINLTRPEEYPEPVMPQPEPETESEKREHSLPNRVSSRPTNNPYKRRRQDTA